MRKITSLLVVSSILATTLVSCGNNFGKKIKIEGTKAEVYYKPGIAGAEARKVGDFLKELGFINNEKAASIQVIKEHEGLYTVRFVYNKDYYEKTEGLEDAFKQYGAKISKAVFHGANVNIALADTRFKDYKVIPYDEATAKALDTEPPAETLNKSDFNSLKTGNVTYYWKGISDEESKKITGYITKNGAFEGGYAEIYITKDGDRYKLRFPVKKEYQSDASIITQVEKVSKEIKENVFPNDPYTFQMIDEQMNVIKSFDY